MERERLQGGITPQKIRSKLGMADARLAQNENRPSVSALTSRGDLPSGLSHQASEANRNEVHAYENLGSQIRICLSRNPDSTFDNAPQEISSVCAHDVLLFCKSRKDIEVEEGSRIKVIDINNIRYKGLHFYLSKILRNYFECHLENTSCGCFFSSVENFLDAPKITYNEEEWRFKKHVMLSFQSQKSIVTYPEEIYLSPRNWMTKMFRRSHKEFRQLYQDVLHDCSRMLIITPKEGLVLQGPFSKKQKAIVTLENPMSFTINFKIKSGRMPLKVDFVPSQGVLTPLSKSYVVVQISPGTVTHTSELIRGTHYLILQESRVPEVKDLETEPSFHKIVVYTLVNPEQEFSSMCKAIQNLCSTQRSLEERRTYLWMSLVLVLLWAGYIL